MENALVSQEIQHIVKEDSQTQATIDYFCPICGGWYIGLHRNTDCKKHRRKCLKANHLTEKKARRKVELSNKKN
jgi:hypothetical protein